MNSLQVWKYGIPDFDKLDKDEFTLKIPKHAKILTVQIQYGKPCIWALVDPTAPLEDRRFRIAGTGHDVEYEMLHYVGTFQLSEGRFIGHIFEV